MNTGPFYLVSMPREEKHSTFKCVTCGGLANSRQGHPEENLQPNIIVLVCRVMIENQMIFSRLCKCVIYLVLRRHILGRTQKAASAAGLSADVCAHSQPPLSKTVTHRLK